MSYGPKLEGERLAEVERAIREGQTDRGIAIAMKLGRNTVMRVRRAIGVPPHPKNFGQSPGNPWRKDMRKPDGPMELRMRANHAAGMSDYDSAQRLGVERWQVQMWRRRWKLPANGKPFAMPAVPFDADRAKALHALGMNDPAIAGAMGIDKTRVRRWRRVAGVPAHARRGGGRGDRVQLAWRDPIWAECRRAVPRWIAEDVADDAAQDMVLAVLEKRLEADAIAASARRYTRQAVNQWANRYGAISLDEDRDGEGWTFMSTVACPASQTPYRMADLVRLAEMKGLDWQAIIQ